MRRRYSKSIIAKFWAKVDISHDNECWNWNGALFENNYGAFSISHSEQVRAHRFACKISGQRVLKKNVVRHTCDNRKCCNPKHLISGTTLENVADRDRKGRQAKGESSGTAKLTEAQVKAIRTDPRGSRKIAPDYGVCASTIKYIKNLTYWRHVQ